MNQSDGVQSGIVWLRNSQQVVVEERFNLGWLQMFERDWISVHFEVQMSRDLHLGPLRMHFLFTGLWGVKAITKIFAKKCLHHKCNCHVHDATLFLTTNATAPPWNREERSTRRSLLAPAITLYPSTTSAVNLMSFHSTPDSNKNGTQKTRQL